MNFEQLKQAQQLKSKLDHAQKELKRMQIEGEAGRHEGSIQGGRSACSRHHPLPSAGRLRWRL